LRTVFDGLSLPAGTAVEIFTIVIFYPTVNTCLDVTRESKQGRRVPPPQSA